MKRFFAFVLAAVIILTCLCGCCLKHEWKEATCNRPMTCSKCGKIQGEPLEHVWLEPTCTEPGKCELCGKLNAEPLGHDYSASDEFICSRCGEQFIFCSANINRLFDLVESDYSKFASDYLGKTIIYDYHVPDSAEVKKIGCIEDDTFYGGSGYSTVQFFPEYGEEILTPGKIYRISTKIDKAYSLWGMGTLFEFRDTKILEEYDAYPNIHNDTSSTLPQ